MLSNSRDNRCLRPPSQGGSQAHTLPTLPTPTHILRTDEQITGMMLSSSLKYKCPKTDMLLSPEYRYTLMGSSRELSSPSRVLGTGEGGPREENQFSPRLAVYLAYFYLSVHNPALTFPVTPMRKRRAERSKGQRTSIFLQWRWKCQNLMTR